MEANLQGSYAVGTNFLLPMFNKKMFDLTNEGQGNTVQHSQRRHSIMNINLGRSHRMHFCNSSHRFQDINVSNL